MKVCKSLLAAIGLAAATILNNSAAFADDSKPERATVPPLFAVLLGGNEVSPEEWRTPAIRMVAARLPCSFVGRRRASASPWTASKSRRLRHPPSTGRREWPHRR